MATLQQVLDDLLAQPKQLAANFIPNQPQNQGEGPTLANAAPLPPAQSQPIAQLPAMPYLGQRQSAPKGFTGTLADMGKNLLSSAAQTIPNAMLNYALFGDSHMAQQMTFQNMVQQLDEKRKKELENKNNMIGDISASWYALRKKAKDMNVAPEAIDMAILGGQQTGTPEIDDWVTKFHGMVQPMIKEGKIGSSDLWQSMQSMAEYDKAIKGDKENDIEFFQRDPEGYAKMKETGREPKEPGRYSEEGMKREKELITHREEEEARNRRPEKPDKPEKIRYQETWIYNPDGTKRVPARFNPTTGVKEPLAKEWQKVPGKGKEGESSLVDRLDKKFDENTPQANILSESDARRQLEAKGIKGEEQGKWIAIYKKEGKVK